MSVCVPDPERELKVEAVSITDGGEGASQTPTLERLWSFSCELTAGRNVSCMAWNKKNLVHLCFFIIPSRGLNF